MKKLILIALLFIGYSVTAQSGHKRANDMTPEQIATLQTKKMTLALALTDDQQKQVQQLNLETAKLRKTKMEERKKKRAEKERPSSEERFAMQSDRLDHQIAHQEKLQSILTDEQFDQWKKMKHRKGKQQKKKRENRRGKR